MSDKTNVRTLLTVKKLHDICTDMVNNNCGDYLVGFYEHNEDIPFEELDWTPVKRYQIDVVENTLDLFSG